MCLIQGRTSHIGNTEIFCFRTKDKEHQITVYSNKVELPLTSDSDGDVKENTAMILAIPRGDEEFQMIDLSEEEDIFRKLNRSFPRRKKKSTSVFVTRSAKSATQPLPVENCGSYEYSLVRSIDEFDRLDAEVFSLDKTVESLLRTKYPEEFAFLVCKIKESKKFHPVAYLHPMRSDGKLFVPTLHFHQGHADENNPDWDHDIYLIGIKSSAARSAEHLVGLQNLPALTRFLPHIAPKEFRKLHIHRQHQNEDLIMAVHA